MKIKLLYESNCDFLTKIEWNNLDYMTSQSYIQNRLEAYILRVKYKNSGYFRKTAEIDNEIIKALKVLSIKD